MHQCFNILDCISNFHRLFFFQLSFFFLWRHFLNVQTNKSRIKQKTKTKMEVLLKILFAYIWGVLHFGSFISYNLCEIFLSWLFSFICVCVCVQLCSHVHFWQNITTRTIWSCCICWIGWANHFHRGFDKSFRIQAGAEPVRVRRLHRWKTKMQLRSEEDASSHSQDYLIWYNKSVPLTWQKDSFTCKDFSLWNKDHSWVNFPFFGNLLMAQDELSVRFCALFAVQPEETYVVEKCKSMN